MDADHRASSIGPASLTQKLYNVEKIPAVKLIRTDTTLDLSHEAKRAEEERRKGIMEVRGGRLIYLSVSDACECANFC